MDSSKTMGRNSMPRKDYRFWTLSPREEFYIVKQKKGLDPLNAKHAIHDHIAFAIYRLFGVKSPPMYIGMYQAQLSLISQILPGYKDLIDCLQSEDPLAEINSHPSVAASVSAYEALEQPLAILGKEALLAASILLEDGDVLGAGLRNIGLIENAAKHRIVNIDPGGDTFYVKPDQVKNLLQDFEKNLSLDDPLLYRPFSLRKAFNNPQCILGNLHFSEFFHSVNVAKLKTVFAQFTSVDDAVLKNIVVREEYLALLEPEDGHAYLEGIYHMILQKKAILKKVLKLPFLDVTPPLPPVVFAQDLILSAPIKAMEYGASHPLKVKRLRNDRTEAPVEKIMPATLHETLEEPSTALLRPGH